MPRSDDGYYTRGVAEAIVLHRSYRSILPDQGVEDAVEAALTLSLLLLDGGLGLAISASSA